MSISDLFSCVCAMKQNDNISEQMRVSVRAVEQVTEKINETAK